MDGRSLPFRKFSFMDMSTCTHYILYSQAYFMGLIFAVRQKFDSSNISHYTVVLQLMYIYLALVSRTPHECGDSKRRLFGKG